MYFRFLEQLRVRMECHTKPELKDMNFKIEKTHIETHIMRVERPPKKFHITMNFWNIMGDTGCKILQREKDDPHTKD